MEKRRTENRHLRKGDKFFFKGKTKEAMACYQEAIREDRSNAVAWNNLGLCHVLFRSLEQAISCYDRALSIDPRNKKAKMNKKKAEKRLKKSKGKKDETQKKHRSLGHYHLERKEFNKALRFFNHKLLDDPTNVGLWQNKALCLLKKGYPEEALSTLAKAEGLQPSISRTEEFQEIKKESNEMKKQKAIVYRERGDDLAKTGAYEKAIRYYKKAVKLDDSSALIWNNLGVAYIKIFLYREAIRCFDRVLHLEPNNEKGKANRERCVKSYTGRKKQAREDEGKKRKLGPPWKAVGKVDYQRNHVLIVCGNCFKKFKVGRKEGSFEFKVLCPFCQSVGIVLTQ